MGERGSQEFHGSNELEVLWFESISESDSHHFLEIGGSDSYSRKKWNHHSYRGVMIPGLESIPELNFLHGYDSDFNSDSSKNWNHNTSALHHSTKEKKRKKKNRRGQSLLERPTSTCKGQLFISSSARVQERRAEGPKKLKRPSLRRIEHPNFIPVSTYTRPRSMGV